MTQPEALRLADAYEATGLRGHIEAAAELRRLHALNAELLEALKDYHKLTASDGWYADKVSAAIAKAEGEQA